MHVQLCRQSTQHGRNLVLKVELLVALGLVGQHKLHVVDANQTDVVRVDCIFESREHFLHRC